LDRRPGFDGDRESTGEWDGWKLYSFGRRHGNDLEVQYGGTDPRPKRRWGQKRVAKRAMMSVS
jgi:hypothetical protein